MDRPSRKTKVVNYSEAKDFDDDDDFAHVRAPPSKKAREDGRQEQKKSSSKSSSQETNSQVTHSEKSRKPLDEKLYERDLEAAITLSLLNNADGTKEFLTSKGDVKVQIPIDENTDPTSLYLSNCSVNGAVLGLDRITADKESSAVQRKSTTKAAEVKTKKDEDEDYQPKMTPDSESDEDFSEPGESEDEEFTIKKAHKTKKEKTTKKDKTKPAPASKREKQPSKPSMCKTQAAGSTTVRSPPTAKLAPARPASSSSVSTSKPAASLSPAGGRIPKWNPPAQVGRSPPSSQSPAVKSPGHGLRLGLSRLVRVKPLHQVTASQASH
ncbi:RAD51-associated protein 1 isoform X2 [Melanotaenia boesemani]|uniref:RAD51-associated protein 1 isoform X2 n=1 Tax=Melanotaenia boesemani TaxID=1250792 RepID=UPI001C04F577|nr:RAD51-associated protein 1 isoform X2 [Melanotaenia boesemani]